MQMEREGYKDISEKEAELYAVTGSKLFFKLMDFAFRDAYWICKFMEIYPNDANYVSTFQAIRRNVVGEALDLAYVDKGEYIELMILNDREIVEDINSEEAKEDLEAICAGVK